MKSSIGDNIWKFRELKNITREHLASELNMSLSNYSKIERGEMDITVSRVEDIAKVLKVDISQILNFDAKNIFNISNNKLDNGSVGKADTFHYHSTNYQDKYVALFEQELERLKGVIKEMEEKLKSI